MTRDPSLRMDTNARTAPPHILIVEDEPKLAELLRDYLRTDGFAATALDDGAQAGFARAQILFGYLTRAEWAELIRYGLEDREHRGIFRQDLTMKELQHCVYAPS